MTGMAVDAADLLDLAASLPEAGEREYRDGATIFTFRGRGMGYVSADGRHLYVKTTLDERHALVDSQPEVYREWYTSGRFGWVRVRLDLVDLDEAGELVLEAFRLTAPKTVVREYDESAARKAPRQET
jgi:hypothetical protein